MLKSKIWLEPPVCWSLKFSGFGLFGVFINFLIANMDYEIRNRMPMKENTIHSMKIFNFSCQKENKVVIFLQLILKKFQLSRGLIGCMMSNQWCLTCFHLFLSCCNTLVLKRMVWEVKSLKFDLSLQYAEVWNFHDLVFLECYRFFDCKHGLWNKK